MRIDVYDFDGTIYDGDSTVDFYFYCLRRKPSLLRHLPRLLLAGVQKLVIPSFDLTAFKSVFFRFVCDIDAKTFAAEFWAQEKTLQKIGFWFRMTPRDLPLVIASASPEFMLAPIAEKLDVATLIGTRVDLMTGKIIGRNCKSSEKIERLHALYGDFSVRSMYTDDTKADGPLLELADEKYLVTRGEVSRLNP